MTHLLRAGAAFLMTLPLLFSQTPSPSPLTVTPTLVSVQLGQPLYCAASWNTGTHQVQVYCYTSTAGHTWDSLIFNSIFYVNTSATVPDIQLCPKGTTPSMPGCMSNAGVTWMFWQDPTTAGLVHWQVSWAGSGLGQGTFQ